MSKTTKKYGKPVFTANNSIDGVVEPSFELTQQWAALDALAKAKYGRKYDNLKDKQKSELHEEIAESKAEGRAKAKAERAEKFKKAGK